MLSYIETHGVEALVICYVFSLLMSTIPPLPTNKGFFIVWAYNFAQILGANASNLVKHSPVGKKIENLVSDSEFAADDGTKTTVHIEQKPITNIKQQEKL